MFVSFAESFQELAKRKRVDCTCEIKSTEAPPLAHKPQCPLAALHGWWTRTAQEIYSGMRRVLPPAMESER